MAVACWQAVSEECQPFTLVFEDVLEASCGGVSEEISPPLRPPPLPPSALLSMLFRGQTFPSAHPLSSCTYTETLKSIKC